MKKSILGFYLYRIFSRLYFHVPVLFVYFYQLGLSVVQIELLLAIYGIVLILAPKAVIRLKNRYRQKTIIVIGELIKAGGLLCFILSDKLVILILAQILSGLGYSFTAGSDSNLLRKIFGTYKGDKYEYKQIEAKSNSYMYISFLTAGVLGSMIFSVNNSFVFLASAISNLLSMAAIMLMREPVDVGQGSAARQENDKEEEAKEIQTGEAGFWKKYYALSRAVTLASFTGFLPYYFFLGVNINLFYFSAVLSLFNLFAFLSSRLVIKLGEKFGYKVLAIGTSSILVFAFFIFSISDNVLICIANTSLLGLASGGVRPITLTNINKSSIGQGLRIKILSSMEQLYGFWNASLLVVGGFIIQFVGFRILMLVIAALYAALIILNSIKLKKAR